MFYDDSGAERSGASRWRMLAASAEISYICTIKNTMNDD